MISKIQGKIKSKDSRKVLVEVTGGISYEILIPKSIMENIKISDDDSEVSLITYHYFQTDQSKGIPILIGFLNEIEKEFFEKFITVSGVGPKAACRALTLPISEIADAIDNADLAVLKSLPGIGEQRAKEIIAKLQGKVGKFGLIQDRLEKTASKVGQDIKEESLFVLLQLQYKKKEALAMIEKALKRNPNIKSSEELFNELYKARQNEKGR